MSSAPFKTTGKSDMAPSIRKGWYLLTSGGRSVGIVHLRTKATEFKYCHLVLSYYYLCIIILLLIYYIMTIIIYYYIVILLIVLLH
jgi:hypothetical protein